MPTTRSNLNLNSGEVFREHAYINCVKSAQRVNFAGSNSWYNDLNDDQYPTEATNGVSFTVYLPGAGTYVVRWLGSGSYSHVSFGSLTNSSKGAYTGGGANGSVVTNGRCTFAVTTNVTSSVTIKGTSISDFVICRLDEEDLLDAGQMFRPAFLNLLADYNPLSLRMMDKQVTNLSLQVRWSERPSVATLTYASTKFITARKCGLMGGSIDAWTHAGYTGMPGGWTHGEIFHAHFADASTSTTPTINLGGRGAKTIVSYMGNTLSASGSNGEVRVLTNVPYTFFYDGYADKLFMYRFGTPMGHPIEALVQLCNESEIPGWFCIPFYADDDWVTNFATYLVNNYTPPTVYIEYSNEIWNTALGFPHTDRATLAGQATFSGIGTGSNGALSGWYGYRFRQIVALMRTVFASAGQSSKLKTILACQGASGNDVSTITNVIENKRFQNASFNELKNANAPIQFADYVSYGYYYAGQTVPGYLDAQWTAAVATKDDVKDACDLYLTGTPSNIKASFQYLVDDFTTNCTFFQTHVVGASGRMENYNTLAASYGKQVMAYEANHEFGAPSASWCTSNMGNSAYGDESGYLNQWFLAWLASAEYQAVVQQYIARFSERSQSVGWSLYGMCTPNPWLTFAKVSPLTETTLGGDTTQTPYGNWRAHVLWNSGKRRLRLTTS